MAQWSSSAINTVRLSMMFNKVLNAKTLAISIGANNRGVLRAMLGEVVADASLNKGMPTMFERMEQTTGNRIEVKLMGSRSTYSAVTDGTTSRSASYTSDRFGAAVFDYTHYTIDEDIQVADLYQAVGNDAKTTSLINEYTNFFAVKMRDTLASSIAASGNNSTSNPGGIFYAIDDTNTYGTIDRSDVTNINYRSYVYSSSGAALSLKAIRTVQDQVRDRGGSGIYGFCDITTYQLVQNLVETQAGQGFATVDRGQQSIYGSPTLSYNGTTFIPDSNCSANTLAIVSPEDWTFFLNSDNFKNGELVRNTGTKSSYVYFADYYAALVCKNPYHQGKITSISS